MVEKTDSLNIPKLVVFAALLSLALPCPADDWPQWLGPKRLPVWNEDQIVDSFPKDGPPLRWKTKVGGGYSGPAVSSGRVYVMDRIADSADLGSGELLHKGAPPKNENFLRRLLPGNERVVCLRESDGKQLWVHEYDCPYTSVATYAIGPRCTPTVDEVRVYTLGAEGDLRCLDADTGVVIWKRNFVQDYSIEIPEWGLSSHPLIDGDRLICMVGGDGTTCMAFDKHTGTEIWRALVSQATRILPTSDL